MVVPKKKIMKIRACEVLGSGPCILEKMNMHKKSIFHATALAAGSEVEECFDCTVTLTYQLSVQTGAKIIGR